MIEDALNLRAFCRKGPPVTFGGVSAYPDGQPVQGIFDRGVQNKLAEQGYGGVDVGMPELRLPFNAFATMPQNEDALTVDGVAYTVSDTRAEDDGAFLVYELELA